MGARGDSPGENLRCGPGVAGRDGPRTPDCHGTHAPGRADPSGRL